MSQKPVETVGVSEAIGRPRRPLAPRRSVVLRLHLSVRHSRRPTGANVRPCPRKRPWPVPDADPSRYRILARRKNVQWVYVHPISPICLFPHCTSYIIESAKESRKLGIYRVS